MITGPNQGFTCVHPSTLSLARFLLLARRFLGLHSVLHTLPLPAAHARVRNRLWTLAWALRPLNQSDLVSPFGSHKISAPRRVCKRRSESLSLRKAPHPINGLRVAGRSRKQMGIHEDRRDRHSPTFRSTHSATIDALNGPEVNGRALTVNGVLPREERGGSRQLPTPAP